MVIEIDDVEHAIDRHRDVIRTQFLNDEGYRVLRFWNNEVMENIDGDIRVIGDALSPDMQKGRP